MLTKQSLIRQFFLSPGKPTSKLLQASLTLSVLLTGLSLTGFAWYYTSHETEYAAQQTFERLTSRTTYRIKTRLQTYFEALHAGQGLFSVDPTTSQLEWRTFVGSLNLQKRYPGIHGLGFIRWVPGRQKAQYEAQVRKGKDRDKQGYSNFRIKPGGTRPDYFVIEYIEPMAINLPAIGLDVKAESRRRAAAERARDQGEVAATAPIVLVQDREKKAGILILLPVYKTFSSSQTVQEKRQALLGFVYAPLKISALIQEVLAEEPDGVQTFQVYDGQELVYEQGNQKQPPWYQSTKTLEVGGRFWDFHFTASSSLLNESERQFSNLVLAVGFLLTLLLTLMVNSLVSSRGQALARNHAMLVAIPDLLLRLKRDGSCVNFIPSKDAKAGTFVPLNRHISEVLPPDLVQHQLQRIERALATGELQVWEHQVMKNGRLCHEEVRLAPCGNDEVLLIIRDITEHKQARLAFEKEFLRSKALFKSSFDGIVVINQQGNVVEASPSFAQMLGYSLEEVTTLNIADWDAQWTRPELLHVMQEVKLVDKPFETLHRRKDGSQYEVEISVSNVQLENESLQICICRDISDRKQKEHALLQAMESAKSASLAKSRFLANMSHELRTPLNAILGFTQVMNRSSEIPIKFQEYLRIINSSGEHLLTLINDVLEMSRIEAGKLSLKEANFNLHQLLRSLQDLFALKAFQKDLTLSFVIDDQVPRSVYGDEAKLRQILTNLISNAIKFTSQGSIEVRVQALAAGTLSTDSLSPASTFTLLLEVEDTGCGIGKRDLELIFDAFMQTESGRHAQGTGLGLSISREFARLMGGDITVQSTINQGSVFSCWVNLQWLEAVNSVEKDAIDSVTGLEPGQPIYRILVVEDVPENQYLLQALLEPIGFEVRTANNGVEAIAEWQAWQPHLILMDIQMPVMDGYEATRQIRLQEATSIDQTKAETIGDQLSNGVSSERMTPDHRTKIIALTAYAFDCDYAASLQAGCDDYMTKPITETALLEIIARHLNVRYCYPDNILCGSSVLPRKALTAQDLKVMSLDWIAQVHEASLDLNDKQIRQLITQIPQQEQFLIDGMLSLLDNFQLETIATLTQAQEVAVTSEGIDPF